MEKQIMIYYWQKTYDSVDKVWKDYLSTKWFSVETAIYYGSFHPDFSFAWLPSCKQLYTRLFMIRIQGRL